MEALRPSRPEDAEVQADQENLPPQTNLAPRARQAGGKHNQAHTEGTIAQRHRRHQMPKRSVIRP